MRTNWLANCFNWIGEVFEKFNPSAFRFFAALLPYVSPIPVAWLTMSSASDFLHFPPNIAFAFVFVLEGIGLWFTSLLVESVVDWITNKNTKSFFMVLVFGIAVSIYIYILVNLNVTLELVAGKSTPELARVITLLCFLPLLTGIGNGYYKLKLEANDKKFKSEAERKEDDRKRQEAERQDRLTRYKIKHGINPDVQVYQQSVPQVSVDHKASEYKDKIWKFLDEQYSKNGRVSRVVDVTKKFNLPYDKAKGFVSSQRKSWMEQNGIRDEQNVQRV